MKIFPLLYIGGSPVKMPVFLSKMHPMSDEQKYNSRRDNNRSAQADLN